MAEEKTTGETAAAPNSKKLIIIFAVVTLLLVAASVAATWFLLGGTEPPVSQEAAAEEEPEIVRGSPEYLQMKPPFTINLKDSQRVLRVSFAILIYGSANEVKVAKLMPQIRSAMLVQLGDILADELETLAGKDKLRALCLKTIHDTVGDAVPSEDIAEIYFTEFVMQ